MGAYDHNLFVQITGWVVAVLATTFTLASAGFLLFKKNVFDQGGKTAGQH